MRSPLPRPSGAFPPLAATLLVALMLAGCLGGDGAAPAADLIAQPLGEAQAMEPLRVRLEAQGGPGVARLGAAWSTATTRNIPMERLVHDAFDDTVWARGTAPTANAQAEVRIDRVPAVPAIYLRAVAETATGIQYGDESRLAVAPVPPTVEVAVRLRDVPTDPYPREANSFRVEASGWEGDASEVGVAWGARSFLGRDPAQLRPEHYGETWIVARGAAVPDGFAVENWTTLLNDTVFLRAWVLADGLHHWSAEARLEMREPPPVDTGRFPVDRQIGIEAGAVPVALLAAFAPAEVTVQVGESVQWENQDEALHKPGHVPDEEDGPVLFESSLASGVRSPVYRFLVPGSYAYECRVHPDTMQGVITVQA